MGGIGWVTLGFLLLVSLVDPSLMVFDVLREEECLQHWRPFLRWTLPGVLGYLVAALLLWAALCGPGRRRRPVRGVAAGLTVIGLLFGVKADRGTERSAKADCVGVPSAHSVMTATLREAVARTPRRQRELAFLCVACERFTMTLRAGGDEQGWPAVMSITSPGSCGGG